MPILEVSSDNECNNFLNKFITCYRCFIGYRVYVLAIDAIYSGQTVDIVRAIVDRHGYSGYRCYNGYRCYSGAWVRGRYGL